MAFVTETDPIAAVREAEELRRQAVALNARADELDPPKVEKPKSSKKTAKKSTKKSPKKTEEVKE